MKKRRYAYKLTPRTIWTSLFPDKYHKWMYLGYTYNIFNEGEEGYQILDDFIAWVDKKARPWWCPKLVLRLLHLIGNDNSIVRVRWRWAYKLHHWILGGVFFTDIKTKYDYVCIYGFFTDEIYEELDKVVSQLDEIFQRSLPYKYMDSPY